MEIMAVYVVAAIVALGGARFGIPLTLHAFHARQYAACLRRIDVLERDLGLTPSRDVVVKRKAITAKSAAQRWADGVSGGADLPPNVRRAVEQRHTVQGIRAAARHFQTNKPRVDLPACKRGYPCGFSCETRCQFYSQDF